MDKNKFDKKIHNYNIERRLLERDDMFNLNSRDHEPEKKRDVKKSKNSKNMGEITGKQFDINELEKGMPARFSLVSNFNDMDNVSYNPQLDFDLFDAKPNIQVSYFDPNQFSQKINPKFANINHPSVILQPNIQNSNILSNIINGFSIDILNMYNLLTNYSKIFIISPFSISISQMVLYYCSHGNTETELRNFFSFPNKETCLSELNQIFINLKKNQNIKLINYIFISNILPINKLFVKKIDQICLVESFDQYNYHKEINKINSKINNYTNGLIKQAIQPNILNPNLSTVIVNIIYFYSNWKNAFQENNTFVKKFISTHQKNVYMMHQKDTFNNYFEDNLNQIIELDFSDDSFVMGLILPKKFDNKLNISSEQFDFYIKNLNKKKINNIQIPKFTQSTKWKLNKLLKEIGLKNIFSHIDISSITNQRSDLHISDAIHEAIIIINEKGVTSSTFVSTMISTYSVSQDSINFIADHPFIYYIRYLPLNIILFIGNYR
ncbi:Serpin (serine protease inhibitor) [uncultured virus]|nr:Serpin (serine protease inhibitor) [uncultured virus]